MQKMRGKEEKKEERKRRKREEKEGNIGYQIAKKKKKKKNQKCAFSEKSNLYLLSFSWKILSISELGDIHGLNVHPHPQS